MKFKGACLPSLPLMGELDKVANGPRSIYQYSSMAPRLSGKNCKFLSFFCLLILKRDLSTRKTTPNIETCPERLGVMHVGILIYRTWPIAYFARGGESNLFLRLER